MHPSPSEPDAAALARERAMALALGTDILMWVAAFTAALWANSLMMMAECIRGGLLIALEVVLLLLMRQVHRARLQAFDYGTVKLEQFGTLVVGTAMGLAGLWVGVSAAQRWWDPPAQAELGLAFAVAAGAANAAQNLLALRALWAAGRDGTSIIMDGQIRIRLTRAACSILVLAALAVNAAAGHGPVAVAAEVAGSAFVAVMMLELSASLWRKALPSLLDRTLDEGRQVSINRVLAEHFDRYDALVSVRSRLLGHTPVVEIVLGFASDHRIGDIQTVLDAVRRSVEDLIPGAQVGVTPVAV